MAIYKTDFINNVKILRKKLAFCPKNCTMGYIFQPRKGLLKMGAPVINLSENDVCFQTPDNGRFRLRAAAIIIENGCVLFASNSCESYYYSIGGAVKLGETSEQTVLREVFEETGIHYEIERLAFVEELFFKRNDGMLKGLDCHEITFFYLMKPRGSQELNSHSKTFYNTIDEKMYWLPLDKLHEFEAYPAFFHDKLKNLPPYPQHIVTCQKKE